MQHINTSATFDCWSAGKESYSLRQCTPNAVEHKVKGVLRVFVGNRQNKSGSFHHQIRLGNSGLDHVKLIYLDFLRFSNLLMAIVPLLKGHSMQSLPNLLNHRLLLGKASHQGISILQTVLLDILLLKIKIHSS